MNFRHVAQLAKFSAQNHAFLCLSSGKILPSGKRKENFQIPPTLILLLRQCFVYNSSDNYRLTPYAFNQHRHHKHRYGF